MAIFTLPSTAYTSLVLPLSCSMTPRAAGKGKGNPELMRMTKGITSSHHVPEYFNIGNLRLPK
jgi:hypothetical protein